MQITLRIINTALILFAVYMGTKQGWAMLSGKAEMLAMFSKWNMGRTAVLTFGLITLLSAIALLFPKTFLAGNFIMAASILLLILLHLNNASAGIGERLKGAATELPFLLLNLVIVYLQYPLNGLKR